MIPETINGKKVTKTEAKFLAQLLIEPGDKKQMVQNPMSGDGVELDNTQTAIYDFIMGAQMQPWWDIMPPANGWNASQKEIVKNFRVALDMFRKYWAHEYMILLD
jgi:hypothetical protein